MNQLLPIRQLLESHAATQQISSKAFFKTGEGQYAAHDQFLGIKVPTLRTIAKEFAQLPTQGIKGLLASPYNEERLLGLFILVNQYQKGDLQLKESIYQFYLDHLQHVNNWNLVDSSAHLILGAHLFETKTNNELLVQLAHSATMWERRIAIVATWYFIRKKELGWTFQLAEALLQDKQDLIHKAAGWMLREAGQVDNTQLIVFLDEYAPTMPRTMLRYAIERLSPLERIAYLNKRNRHII
jgi:3-methyladenine DNA glycosylase AlkD